MNVTVEEIGKNLVKLTIEVGADILEDGLDKSYKKSAKRFNVPGFRKGRAPRSFVERYYGVEVLYEGAVDAIFGEYYDRALAENNIEAVDLPEFELIELERGKPFRFSATVPVKPEVKLGDYIGVEAERRTVVVTEDDVETELKTEAEKNARLIPVEDRPSQMGDTVTIDYEGRIDGVPFEGGKAEGYNLELGSNTFIPGFEEQLAGKSAGESVLAEVRFPDDYQSEELKGKEAVFDVTVHAIKYKELPEIDDDFAQDVSEFDSLDEYKKDIRKRLTESEENRADTEYENALVTKIVDGAQVDIPDAMINRQMERNMKEFEMRMAYQGLDLERYFEQTSTARDQLMESMRERSANEIKTTLVMEQIAKEQGLEVTDAEFEAEIRLMAERRKMEYDKYMEQLSEKTSDYIRSKKISDKIITFIKDNAKRA